MADPLTSKYGGRKQTPGESEKNSYPGKLPSDCKGAIQPLNWSKWLSAARDEPLEKGWPISLHWSLLQWFFPASNSSLHSRHNTGSHVELSWWEFGVCQECKSRPRKENILFRAACGMIGPHRMQVFGRGSAVCEQQCRANSCYVKQFFSKSSVDSAGNLL